MKILNEIEIFDRRSDKSGRITGLVQKTLLESRERPDKSSVQTRIVQFAKPDTLILAGQTTDQEFRYLRIFFKKPT
jgi:hypothetical protein